MEEVATAVARVAAATAVARVVVGKAAVVKAAVVKVRVAVGKAAVVKVAVTGFAPTPLRCRRLWPPTAKRADAFRWRGSGGDASDPLDRDDGRATQ